jgi:hypothetical protein
LQCSDGSSVWMPLRCRLCEGCYTARRNKQLSRLLSAVKGSVDIGFLTLTSRPGKTWPDIMKEWSHFIRWARKRSPHLEYAAVKEQGSRTGMKHLHVILLNWNYTPQAAIAAEWQRLTGAHIVNVQRVNGEKAAGYASKYVAKHLSGSRKNVTYSKGFPKLDALPLKLTKTDETGPFGPQGIIGITEDGGLVTSLAPGCKCFGHIRPLTKGDHWWLRSLTGPLQPQSPASSGP